MVRAKNPQEKAFLSILQAERVKCWIGDYLVS